MLIALSFGVAVQRITAAEDAAAPAPTPVATTTAASTRPSTGFESLLDDAQAKAKEQVEAIAREVDRRRKTHSAAAASALAVELDRVRAALFNRPVPRPLATTPAVTATTLPAGEADLYVVALGVPAHWRKNEVVEVVASDRPVVLALASMETLRWEIRVADGAKLVKVLVGGQYEPKVTWADPAKTAPLEMHVRDRRDQQAFVPVQRDYPQFEEFAASLRRLTGMPIASYEFHNKGTGGPYRVGVRGPGWYGQVVREQLEPLYKEATAFERARRPVSADEARFYALHMDLTPAKPRVLPNGRQMPAMPFDMMRRPRMAAEFTVTGPVPGTYTTLGDGSERYEQIAVDPADDQTFYALMGGSVRRISRATGNAAPIEFKGDIPPVRHATAIAFDTKRHRLVVRSGAYLVEYWPARSESTYLAELATQSAFQSPLVYSAAHDSFFAFEPAHTRHEMNEAGVAVIRQVPRPMLHRIAPDGTLAESVPLEQSIPAGRGGPFGLAAQFAALGDKLVVLAPPPVRDPRQVPGPPQCLVVDPKTGRVVASHITRERLDPAAVENITDDELARLWRQLGSEKEEEVEPAVKRLVAAGDRAVAFLTARPAQEGPADEQVAEWIDALDEEDPRTRESATAELLRAGDRVQQAVAEALKGELDPEARSRLEMVAEEIKSDTTARRGRRQAQVIKVLKEIASEAAVEQLIDLSVQDPESATAKEARAALRAL